MAASAARMHQTTHIYEMMEHLGIEPGGGTISSLGLMYATAFRRCQACSSKETCRDWLDCRRGSTMLAPGFCPNADILVELQLKSSASFAPLNP